MPRSTLWSNHSSRRSTFITRRSSRSLIRLVRCKVLGAITVATEWMELILSNARIIWIHRDPQWPPTWLQHPRSMQEQWVLAHSLYLLFLIAFSGKMYSCFEQTLSTLCDIWKWTFLKKLSSWYPLLVLWIHPVHYTMHFIMCMAYM